MNTILGAACSSHGVFNAQGFYQVTLVQPDSSYSPKQHFERFRPLLSRVSLVLPEVLRQPVAFHTGNRELEQLITCFKSTEKVLAETTSEILCDLQAYGTFNITAHAVMNALKNETLIQTESPLLAYHLCHKEGEAMPSMGWYQSVDASTLTQVYDDCADHLFR